MAAISFNSKIGIITIDADETGIKALSLTDKPKQPDISKASALPLLNEAKKQVLEYLEGSRKEFDLLLAPEGSVFQQKVWKALTLIPYGETRSYGEIAKLIGNPKACRAVGMANNKNPISLIIPCHRVIGSNGSLVGYGWGLELKAELLKLEKNNL